jgi:hypothetical protein
VYIVDISGLLKAFSNPFLDPKGPFCQANEKKELRLSEVVCNPVLAMIFSKHKERGWDHELRS